MNRRNYPLTYVLILTWNQKKDTLECLHSVMKLDYPNYRVLLIDNSSMDGTLEQVREDFPEVETIRCETNLGYAGGNNVGLEHAIENGAEYIFVLNNDTEIGPGCLSRLVETLEDDDSIGVAGATVYYHCDPERIWFNGGRLNRRTGTMKANAYRVMDRGQFTELIESDYAPGCGMLVRSSIIQEIGGIDRRYFIYFEETDWCLRIKKLGYRVVINPGAKVWHKISLAFGKATPTFLYYTARNNFLFIKMNIPRRTKWNAYLRCIKHYALQIRWLVTGEDDQKWTKIRAICTGVFDFLLSRYGRGTAQFLLSNSK